MLTDDEIEAVILACMATEGGASEADMERAVDWAAQTRIASLVLDMVLVGDLAVSIGPDGEPVFSAREEGDGEAGVKNRLTTPATYQDSLQVDDGD